MSTIDVKPVLPVDDLTRENASLRRQLALKDVELNEAKEELRNTVTTFKTALSFKNYKIRDLEVQIDDDEDEEEGGDLQRGDGALIRVKQEPGMEEERMGRGARLAGRGMKRRRMEEGGVEACAGCGRGGGRRGTMSYAASVHARFTEISKLGGKEEYFSQTVEMVGLEWGMVLSRQQIDGQDYLAIHIEIKNDHLPPEWSCAVLDKVHLYSHLPGKPGHTSLPSPATIYSAESKSWGYDDFIPFKDLLMKKNGFVVNDAIMMSIDMKAFPSGPAK